MNLSRRSFLGAALLVGCARTQPQVRTGPSPPATELVKVLQQRHARLRSISLGTRATNWMGGQRTKATVDMLVDRTGRLRVEAVVALQGTAATLAVGDGSFALLDVNNRVYRRGPACPANVASLIRIPLLPEEIAAVLLGDAPLPAGARPVGVTYSAELGAEVLEIASPPSAQGRGTSRLWIAFRPAVAAPLPFDVVAVEGLGAQGNARWRVRYEDLEIVNEVTVPGVIRFAEPGRSFDEGVELKVREREVNPGFTPDSFALPPPPGYPIETVGCEPAALPAR